MAEEKTKTGKNFVEIGLIIFLLLLIAYAVFGYIQGMSSEEKCTDVYSILKIKYDICYDSVSKNIILLLGRDASELIVKSFDISYTDSTAKKSVITELPEPNQVKVYNFSADQYPGRIKIIPNLIMDIPNLCTGEKLFLVRDCSEENFSVFLDSQGQVKINHTASSTMLKQFSLSAKNKTWSPDCNSKWACAEWESCIDGVQARRCIDAQACDIPVNTPDFTRKCSACEENWKCSWSPCQNEYTAPSCIDLNSCNTNFSVPGKISCIRDNCIPDITCTSWQSCSINLGIKQISGNVQELQGIKSRLCTDKNKCASPAYDYMNCTVKADIYLKETEWGSEKYLEVYDKLTNKILSRVKYSEDLSSLNLNFYF